MNLADFQQRAAEALERHLHWVAKDAVGFVLRWDAEELEDALEHCRRSTTPAVGLASCVYRVRLRLAGGRPLRVKMAEEEAARHHDIIKRLPLARHREFYRDDRPAVYVDPYRVGITCEE